MSLSDCPHMAAKCPHYNELCDDAASSQCHYIKNTTGVATGVLGLSFLHAPIRVYREILIDVLEDEEVLQKVDKEFVRELRKEFIEFLRRTKEKRKRD